MLRSILEDEEIRVRYEGGRCVWYRGLDRVLAKKVMGIGKFSEIRRRLENEIIRKSSGSLKLYGVINRDLCPAARPKSLYDILLERAQ